MAAIVLDHAHLSCPIIVGWSNDKFRRHMVQQWPRYILLPGLCCVIPLAVGVTSLTTRDPAFRALVAVYFWCDAWHFASQNLGVCAIVGGSLRQRYAAFWLTIGIILLAATVANVLWIVLAGAGVSLIHWLQDLRLSSFMVSRAWLFTAVVLAVGVIGFLWKSVVVGNPRFCGPLAACAVMWSFPILLSLRLGLGFWHQLMSRWVWSSTGQKLLA